MNKHRVFVYGSLRPGFANNSLFLGTSKLVLENAQTAEARFTMKSFTSYPAVLDGGTHRVRGDVYEVTDAVLRRLDYLEANGLVYQRRLVAVDGIEDRCWMYVYIEHGGHFLDDHRNPVVLDGIAEWQTPVALL